MVTIHISNSSVLEDGEELEEEEFQVPRGLICAYSAYFDSVFRKTFAESNTGRSVIDDVRPWAFRVYVGWLYFQQISYISGRTEPRDFRKSSHAVEPSYDASLGDTTSRVAADAELQCPATDTDPAALAQNAPSDPQEQVTDSSHKQCAMEDRAKYDTSNDQDPLTWDWQDLFELYVLGEKVEADGIRLACMLADRSQYDTRAFRMHVLETLQKKRITDPRNDNPTPAALTYLYDNIPAGARILDMVAKMYYERFVSLSSLSRNMNYFSRTPATFLAAGLLAAAKRAKALKCKECAPGKGRHRHSDDHTHEDLLGFDQMDNCKYHEHGDDPAEQARCKAGMDVWNQERLQAAQAERDEEATS
ncbi:hypothetical protein PRZ48_008334 [Zasmidium cellare]|uniref:BTB domain-containing protein n=1 Tax=Zasmidium cellare TaxID=395010 RepID=A0ABR0EG16_ZASCE|nr:hypothetical protein PRZ48_008334 [Zasmidium cellare]